MYINESQAAPHALSSSECINTTWFRPGLSGSSSAQTTNLSVPASAAAPRFARHTLCLMPQALTQTSLLMVALAHRRRLCLAHHCRQVARPASVTVRGTDVPLAAVSKLQWPNGGTQTDQQRAMLTRSYGGGNFCLYMQESLLGWRERSSFRN